MVGRKVAAGPYGKKLLEKMLRGEKIQAKRSAGSTNIPTSVIAGKPPYQAPA